MNNEISQKILKLNLLSFNIVWIDDTYYAIDKYNVNRGVGQIEVEGRDITQFLETMSMAGHLNIVDKNDLIAQVNKLIQVKRRYSDLFTWKMFLAV